MTRTECKKIIAIMMQIWKNYKPGNIEAETDMLYHYFSNYSYEQVSIAIDMYVINDSKGFAPTVGQLLGQMKRKAEVQQLNSMEAWSLVSVAIRRSAWYSVEEFNKLSPTIQRAIGSSEQLLSWATDENYNESVVMSQFIRVYQIEAAREAERSISQTAARKALAGKSPERQVLADRNKFKTMQLETNKVEETKREPPPSERTRKKLQQMRESMGLVS